MIALVIQAVKDLRNDFGWVFGFHRLCLKPAVYIGFPEPVEPAYPDGRDLTSTDLGIDTGDRDLKVLGNLFSIENFFHFVPRQMWFLGYLGPRIMDLGINEQLFRLLT